MKDDEGKYRRIRLKLSEPLLKFRPREDTINTLLHEYDDYFIYVHHSADQNLEQYMRTSSSQPPGTILEETMVPATARASSSWLTRSTTMANTSSLFTTRFTTRWTATARTSGNAVDLARIGLRTLGS